jgi:hypothetical protein
MRDKAKIEEFRTSIIWRIISVSMGNGVNEIVIEKRRDVTDPTLVMVTVIK